MPNYSYLFLDQVSKVFNLDTIAHVVLDNVTYTFDQSKTYAITGVSGTGKSTILNLMAGLDNPNSGDIYFNNQQIARLTNLQKQEFLNKSIGLIFQFPYLIKELSVLDNIIIKELINSKYNNINFDRAYKLLKLINLEHKAKESSMMLSGGEQQRIAIARALFTQPKFLIADEPTAHLDSKTRDIILDLLLESHANWNMGLIVASHDLKVANRMNKILEIKNYKLIENL